MVEDALGKDRIKAFWLAGHSLGGQPPTGLINTDPFFQQRLKGWVSLSAAARLQARGRARHHPRRRRRPARPAPGAAAPPGNGGGLPRQAGGLRRDLPEPAFSFIYETGEHELTAAGCRANRSGRRKLGCGARPSRSRWPTPRRATFYDSRPQPNPNPIGAPSPPGRGQGYLYPGCSSGRVVADIVRATKATPKAGAKVTEQIVKLMMAAK